jgi:hypothetical protein
MRVSLRVAHTLVYPRQTQPERAICFGVGAVCTLHISIRSLIQVLSPFAFTSFHILETMYELFVLPLFPLCLSFASFLLSCVPP